MSEETPMAVLNPSGQVSDKLGHGVLRWKLNRRAQPNVVHFERVAGADPVLVAHALDGLRRICIEFGYPLYSFEEFNEAISAKQAEVDALPADGVERDIYVDLTDYRDMSRDTVCFGMRKVRMGDKA